MYKCDDDNNEKKLPSTSRCVEPQIPYQVQKCHKVARACTLTHRWLTATQRIEQTNNRIHMRCGDEFVNRLNNGIARCNSIWCRCSNFNVFGHQATTLDECAEQHYDRSTCFEATSAECLYQWIFFYEKLFFSFAYRLYTLLPRTAEIMCIANFGNTFCPWIWFRFMKTKTKSIAINLIA